MQTAAAAVLTVYFETPTQVSHTLYGWMAVLDFCVAVGIQESDDDDDEAT